MTASTMSSLGDIIEYIADCLEAAKSGARKGETFHHEPACCWSLKFEKRMPPPMALPPCSTPLSCCWAVVLQLETRCRRHPGP